MDRKTQLKQLLSNANTVLEAMRYSANSVGADNNTARYASYGTFLKKYNSLVRVAAPMLTNPTLLDQIDVAKINNSGALTWINHKECFDLAYINLALLKSLLEGEIGYGEDQTQNLKDFIQANLRKAVFVPPEKEVAVQNAIETLLVGRGMAKGTEYDRETGRVKTSGKEFIPDFIFPGLSLCLEVKLSKSTENRKAIVDEINADIKAYSAAYERQFYVIYDLSTIRDEAEFKRDLEVVPGVSVLIIKH
jgi:hypothetical protein